MIVSVAAGKLVMADNDGKNERGHEIDAVVKITLDGKGRAHELKKQVIAFESHKTWKAK